MRLIDDTLKLWFLLAIINFGVIKTFYNNCSNLEMVREGGQVTGEKVAKVQWT